MTRKVVVNTVWALWYICSCTLAILMFTVITVFIILEQRCDYFMVIILILSITQVIKCLIEFKNDKRINIPLPYEKEGLW